MKFELSRRRVLGALGTFLFWRPWVRGLTVLLAPMATATAAIQPGPSPFNDEETQTLRMMTSDIIPTDDTPGASEAQIADFIAFVMSQYPAELQYQFRMGLGAVNQVATQIHGRPYPELGENQRHDVIRFLSTDPYLAPFWRTVRTLTVLRFYDLPVGYEPLGLPGPNVATARFRNADHLIRESLCRVDLGHRNLRTE